MANTTVGIVFEVANRGTAGIQSITRDLGRFDQTVSSLSRTMSRLTTAGLVAGGVLLLERAGRATLTMAAEQESAERSLAKSLAVTNDARAETIESLRRQAQEMASLTDYSDEQILREMAIAHNTGLATDQLVSGTKAAIGLAAALDKDLSRTMRVVALASQGQTRELGELGIAVNRNASAAETYQTVLAKGHAGFEVAVEDARTLKGETVGLLEAWRDMIQELSRPVTKPAAGAIGTLGNVFKTLQTEIEVIREREDMRLDRMYKSLSPDMQESFQKAYESKFGKQLTVYGRVGSLVPLSWKGQEEFDYTSAVDPQERSYAWQLLRSYQRAAQRQREGPPTTQGLAPEETTGLSTLTPIEEQAREQVVRLNAALNEQVKATWLAAQGHERTAQMVQFETQVRQGYAGDVEKQKRMIEEYRVTLESLAAIERRAQKAEAQRQFNAELESSIASIRQEADLYGLTNKQRERQTILQNAANEAMRRGVELTAAQRQELERAVETMQRARDLADLTFGQGFALGIRNMQEELKTAGQIGYDLSSMLRDGVVGAINDAVFRAEDLGEALEQVGLQMLEYWAQEAMWKPLVTQGMDFGTQLLGNVAGSLAGSWFGGGSAGSAAGDLNPAMASIAHAGGVAGRDILPTRIVPASAFAHAQRFHTGVGPGERAAVIRDEEGVFTPGQMRALGRGLGGDRAVFGEMAGLLGQILGAVRDRQTLSATIVDKRQTPQEWFESRQGEQAWKYHAARNG